MSPFFFTPRISFLIIFFRTDEPMRIDHALSRRRRKSSSRHQIINHRWRLIAIYGSANKRVCKYNSVTAMIKMPRRDPKCEIQGAILRYVPI